MPDCCANVKRHNKTVSKTNTELKKELKKARRHLAELAQASKEYKAIHSASVLDELYKNLSAALFETDEYFKGCRHVR